MPKYESLPFARGEYQTDDSANLVNPSLSLGAQVGRTYEIEDVDWNAVGGAKPQRSGKIIKLRLVKNTGTAAILPKRLTKYDLTAGNFGSCVIAHTNVTAEDWAGVADEFLPSTGVPANGYFYIVTEGPSMMTTPVAGADFNGDIAVGNPLVAATAAASTGTTAGRPQNRNITASTQTGDYTSVVNNAANQLGRALSAATTGNTNTDILVDVGMW
jgi:hypothetical protein